MARYTCAAGAFRGADHAPPGCHQAMLQDLLKASPLFAPLSDDDLAKVLLICRAREFKNGDALYAEGDQSNHFDLVIEGAIRISKMTPLGEEALAVLRSGQFFGEMGLLTGAPRSAHAYGHEPGRLLSFPCAELRALLEREPDLARQFLWAFARSLCERLAETNQRMATFMTLSKFG